MKAALQQHTHLHYPTSGLSESQLNTEVKDIRGFFPQSSGWFALQLKVQLSDRGNSKVKRYQYCFTYLKKKFQLKH